MADEAPHPLVDCHASILQRIIDLADASDLFLLRQVARRWRSAVDGRIKRLRPNTPPTGLGERFRRLESLDLTGCDTRLADVFSTPCTGLLELACLFRFGSALPEESLAQQLPGLTGLLLHGGHADDAAAAVRMAACCRSLRRLQLMELRLRWALLQAAVAQLADSLTGLDLSRSKIIGVVPLNGLQALNTGRLQALHLSLDGRHLPNLRLDAAFSDLAAFTSLRQLELNKAEMTPAQLEQLNSLTQLTCLKLFCTRLSTAAVAQLTRLTRVSELRLGQNSFQGAEEPWDAAAALASFPDLTNLHLEVKGEVSGVNCLSNLTRLTQLRTYGRGLERSDAVLLHLTGLQDLCLWGVLHDWQLRQLSGLTRLTSLGLFLQGDAHQLQPPDPRLNWLLALRALQDSCLDPVWLDAAALQPLAALPALRRLSIGNAARRVRPGCDLWPLGRLAALQWLSLPPAFERPEQLPARLRVPFLKGRRGDSLL